MSRGIAIAFLSLVVAFAFTPVTGASGWETYDESMATSWEATYNSGDADACADYYTADGIRMPPNDKAVEGREAIAAYIRQGMEMGLAKVKLETVETEVSGDMAFARGTYVIFDTEGNPADSGKWLQIGKKVDGMWHAYRDIWNSDNPLPE